MSLSETASKVKWLSLPKVLDIYLSDHSAADSSLKLLQVYAFCKLRYFIPNKLCPNKSSIFCIKILKLKLKMYDDIMKETS